MAGRRREGGHMPYLANAPADLKSLHSRLEGSRYKHVLERLLTDSRMNTAWHEIEQRLSDVEPHADEYWKRTQYQKLWRERSEERRVGKEWRCRCGEQVVRKN